MCAVHQLNRILFLLQVWIWHFCNWLKSITPLNSITITHIFPLYNAICQSLLIPPPWWLNIGKGPVSPSVHPHAFLHNDWMDFLHIGYHDQVSWGADACKIVFGSVPNLYNYGYFFINFEFFCAVSENRAVKNSMEIRRFSQIWHQISRLKK